MEASRTLSEQEMIQVSGGDLESEANLREFLERFRKELENYVPPGNGVF